MLFVTNNVDSNIAGDMPDAHGTELASGYVSEYDLGSSLTGP